ncbi:T9SS type A sorting domain-containing protein [Spirosoma fluminis]
MHRYGYDPGGSQHRSPPQPQLEREHRRWLTCAQPTAVLNASANGNAELVITGPGNQSYSANTATVSQPGEYTLTATRNNGCSTTRTVTVESNTTAPENVTLTNNGPLTCTNTSVQLTAASSTTGVTYGLVGPEGFSASGPTVSVNRPGTYTLTATGANGCTAVQTTTVESNTTAPQNVTLTNSGPLSFTNSSVTLTATEGAGYSYNFSPNAAQQGSSNKATVNTAGVYSVTVTRQDNGCTATASTTVLGGNNPTVCRGGTAIINVAVEGDPVKYEWYKNSLTTPKIMETPQLFRGTATSSLTLINAQSNTQGNFYLKVTDRSNLVKIYGPFRLTVDASCRAREIAQLETPLQVELAPNPIQQDRLRAVVRGAESHSLQVELVDLSGKPIRQQRWQQADAQQVIDWEMQGQSSGLYLLQVVSEAGSQ